jgi:hypothetical protein
MSYSNIHKTRYGAFRIILNKECPDCGVGFHTKTELRNIFAVVTAIVNELYPSKEIHPHGIYTHRNKFLNSKYDILYLFANSYFFSRNNHIRSLEEGSIDIAKLVEGTYENTADTDLALFNVDPAGDVCKIIVSNIIAYYELDLIEDIVTVLLETISKDEPYDFESSDVTKIVDKCAEIIDFSESINVPYIIGYYIDFLNRNGVTDIDITKTSNSPVDHVTEISLKYKYLGLTYDDIKTYMVDIEDLFKLGRARFSKVNHIVKLGLTGKPFLTGETVQFACCNKDSLFLSSVSECSMCRLVAQSCDSCPNRLGRPLLSYDIINHVYTNTHSFV